MLTVNLNVAFGLFNGYMGKVIDILYLHDGPQNYLPDVVWWISQNTQDPHFYNHTRKLFQLCQ
jgi:hypothetical protein